MSSFWSDTDGFTKEDFEKLILGICFLIVTLAITYKFMKDVVIDMNIFYFDLGIGSLFVARKAFSYFKPETYYQKQTEIEPQTIPKDGY